MTAVRVVYAVGKCVLQRVLVVCCKIGGQSCTWFVYYSGFCTSLIALVGSFAGRGIAHETVLPIVECGYRECCFVVKLMVVCGFNVAIEFCTKAEAYFRALMIHGILRVQSYQSAFGVHSV